MVFFRMPAPADTPTDDLSPEALEYIKTLTKLHARFTVLSERTPVNRKAYVFIGRGGGGLSGNAKYLFLHMARKHPEVESWFLTESLDDYKALRQANLPVLFYPDEVTIHKLAEAGTVVVESISFRRALYMPLLAKARQVQLWHGVGNKKIGFQLANVPVLEGRTDNLVADHSDYDIIVTTSPFYTEEVFKKSMDAKEFLDYGYPRTDIFRSRVNADALLGCDTAAYAAVRAARKKGWKVLLYAPTFRDTEITPLTLDAFNLLDFFDLLKKHRIHLILKPHPRVPMKAPGLPE
ncbi:MAG: CDP-glycerol glycerophosphotransferase family protein [Desulfovibrionaceae bacterium]